MRLEDKLDAALLRTQQVAPRRQANADPVQRATPGSARGAAGEHSVAPASAYADVSFDTLDDPFVASARAAAATLAALTSQSRASSTPRPAEARSQPPLEPESGSGAGAGVPPAAAYQQATGPLSPSRKAPVVAPAASPLANLFQTTSRPGGSAAPREAAPAPSNGARHESEPPAAPRLLYPFAKAPASAAPPAQSPAVAVGAKLDAALRHVDDALHSGRPEARQQLVAPSPVTRYPLDPRPAPQPGQSALDAAYALASEIMMHGDDGRGFSLLPGARSGGGAGGVSLRPPVGDDGEMPATPRGILGQPPASTSAAAQPAKTIIGTRGAPPPGGLGGFSGNGFKPNGYAARGAQQPGTQQAPAAAGGGASAAAAGGGGAAAAAAAQYPPLAPQQGAAGGGAGAGPAAPAPAAPWEAAAYGEDGAPLTPVRVAIASAYARLAQSQERASAAWDDARHIREAAAEDAASSSATISQLAAKASGPGRDALAEADELVTSMRAAASNIKAGGAWAAYANTTGSAAAAPGGPLSTPGAHGGYDRALPSPVPWPKSAASAAASGLVGGTPGTASGARQQLYTGGGYAPQHPQQTPRSPLTAGPERFFAPRNTAPCIPTRARPRAAPAAQPQTPRQRPAVTVPHRPAVPPPPAEPAEMSEIQALVESMNTLHGGGVAAGAIAKRQAEARVALARSLRNRPGSLAGSSAAAAARALPAGSAFWSTGAARVARAAALDYSSGSDSD